MYNHIRGILVNASATRFVVETGGVGWDITVPLSTSSKAPSCGKEVKIFTHLAVREDALDLYGFLTEDERTLFRTMIGISGIGPSIAIQILSAVSPRDFAIAVEKQDVGFIKKIKGIGEKKAKRIILELKGSNMVLSEGEVSPAMPQGVGAEAVAALSALGVPAREAVARVEKVMAAEPDLVLEDIIKKALR